MESKSTFRYATLSPLADAYHLIAGAWDGEIHLVPIDSGRKCSLSPYGQMAPPDHTSRILHDTDPRLPSIMRVDRARKVICFPALSMLAVQRSAHVDLVQFKTGLLIHRIDVPKEHAPISNLHLIHSSTRVCDNASLQHWQTSASYTTAKATNLASFEPLRDLLALKMSRTF